MSFYSSSKKTPDSDDIEYLKEVTGKDLEFIVPVPIERLIMTRWGLLSRDDIINRLCAAFPGDIEAIRGLAELNPDKWPKLEMVKPGTQEIMSMPGRQLFTAGEAPKYMLIWVKM